MPDPIMAIVARVASPHQPAFQLRKGELGKEILESFRPGSIVLYRTMAEIVALGLDVATTEGANYCLLVFAPAIVRSSPDRG